MIRRTAVVLLCGAVFLLIQATVWAEHADNAVPMLVTSFAGKKPPRHREPRQEPREPRVPRVPTTTQHKRKTVTTTTTVAVRPPPETTTTESGVFVSPPPLSAPTTTTVPASTTTTTVVETSRPVSTSGAKFSGLDIAAMGALLVLAISSFVAAGIVRRGGWEIRE